MAVFTAILYGTAASSALVIGRLVGAYRDPPASLVGNTVFGQSGDGVVAGARAFAGGAVLAGISIEILPDAYEEGGPLIALATAVGFVLTFVLKA
jgi:ZIP family zinc transporter